MYPDYETPFRYISSVLKHIESNSCEEDITEGKLLWKFLRLLGVTRLNLSLEELGQEAQPMPPSTHPALVHLARITDVILT